MSVMNAQLVGHIADLANIPVSVEEEAKLARGFATTLAVVDQILAVDTGAISATHQVTGLENVSRVDEVDEEHTFSQEEALANARNQYAGFFVVPQVIGE